MITHTCHLTIEAMLIPENPIKPEPRWPGWVAMLAVGGMIYALPSTLTPGPDWLVLVLMAAFQAIAMVLHFRGQLRAGQAVGYTSLATGTLALLAALAFLVEGLPSHRESPRQLLVAAAELWISNLLVFASWY